MFLLGERGGLPPEGFDAGNSPTALASTELPSNVAVQATSNGTPALLACVGAPLVMPAAVVNAAAATRVAIDAERDVLIVCAGLRGGFGEDDVLAAGLLVDRLVAAGATTGPEAQDALERYQAARNDLAEAFRQTEHGAVTVASGSTTTSCSVRRPIGTTSWRRSANWTDVRCYDHSARASAR